MYWKKNNNQSCEGQNSCIACLCCFTTYILSVRISLCNIVILDLLVGQSSRYKQPRTMPQTAGFSMFSQVRKLYSLLTILYALNTPTYYLLVINWQTSCGEYVLLVMADAYGTCSRYFCCKSLEDTCNEMLPGTRTLPTTLKGVVTLIMRLQAVSSYS